MTAPKMTHNCCRRKERRLHRRGKIKSMYGCYLMSTKSRRHPYVGRKWSAYTFALSTNCKIEGER